MYEDRSRDRSFGLIIQVVTEKRDRVLQSECAMNLVSSVKPAAARG